MTRILIVEDEPAMQMGLKDNFEFEGYQVFVAGDGETGQQMALDEKPDLVILDIMLPKKSGFDVCRDLRQQGFEAPIIMLTARGQETDKVVGLELGADDYLTKPFSVRELLARVKAVLRRTNSAAKQSPHTQTVGLVAFDFDHYTAKRNGEDLKMTHKEFEIIKYFLAHIGEVISRSQLLDDVWGYDAMPTSRTVDNHILKLRQKIEPDPENPRHILTVHGLGYKYIN